MSWRDTGKIVGTAGNDNVQVEDSNGRVITMPRNYFESQTGKSSSGSDSSSGSSLYTSPSEIANNISSDIISRLGQGIYHPYNENTGTTPYWSFTTNDGRTIHATDSGRGYEDAANRAGRYLNMMDNQTVYPDDGKAYAYTDRYGFSHVGSRADAEAFGQPGSIQEYGGDYLGGYARDDEGNRIMVNTPGAIPYGNEQQKNYLDKSIKEENLYNSGGGDNNVKQTLPPLNKYNYGSYNDSFEKRDTSGAKIGISKDGRLNAVSRYLAKDIWANR